MSQLNSSMEKIFLHHIFQNPIQFSKVDSSFFKNADIRFVYHVIRENYLVSENKEIPSPKQILAMVKLHQEEREISKELLKSILDGDNTQYTEDWVDQHFKAWKLSKNVRDNVNKSIDAIRSLDDLSYDNVKGIASKIKVLSQELDMLDEDNDDLGLDFDEIDDHRQDVTVLKIPTGWTPMDSLLNGGWDYASLTVFVGATNIGKSMWLNNIAVNIADQGKNVLYVTLEMGDKRCMKRMGSMRLKIPINEYDERSKDKVYMGEKIKALRHVNGGMFEQKCGKLFIRKFATSSLTISELDLFIKKLEEQKKVKLDAICIDYINIMGVEKGMDINNMLFLKGKHLAEGIRYLADKHNVAMITATQTDKDVWGSNDIALKDIPESKAVAETSDVVFGIIRNPEMKKNNIYHLKILKLRDGEYKEEKIRFKFNTDYLTMENAEFIGNV